jgi:hypothetical protein
MGKKLKKPTPRSYCLGTRREVSDNICMYAVDPYDVDELTSYKDTMDLVAR